MTNTEETADRRTLRQRIVAWLDQTTTRRQVLPAYGLLFAAIFGAFWLDARNDAERAHDQCLARAEGRADFRAVLIRRDEGLVTLFPDSDNARLIVDFWRADLDATLPALDPAAC